MCKAIELVEEYEQLVRKFRSTQEELRIELSRIDKKVSNLYHKIEFEKDNHKLTPYAEELQETLIHRRYVKNQSKLIEKVYSKLELNRQMQLINNNEQSFNTGIEYIIEASERLNNNK